MIVLTRRKTNILSRSKRLIEASKSSILIKFLQLIVLKASLAPIPVLKTMILRWKSTSFDRKRFPLKDQFLIEIDFSWYKNNEKANNMWVKAKKRTYLMTHSSCCNQLLMGSMFVYLHMDKLVPARPLLWLVTKSYPE